MKRRAFMGLGATSIGVGALYGTGAFSSVNAGRGVSVNAAEDSEDALLGIDNVDTSDDPVFTNNTSLDMVVTLEEVDTEITFDGEPSPYTFPEDGVLEPGDSRSVEIQAEDDSEDALVDVTAELSEDGTKTGEITLRRDFSVSPAESINFTGDASAPGQSRRFIFTLTNEGTVPVTITEMSIDETEGDWDRVTDGLFVEDDGTKLIDGPIEIGGDREPFLIDELDDENTIERAGQEGDEVTWELNKFEEEGRKGQPPDVTGFRATFQFEASGETYVTSENICTDECSF